MASKERALQAKAVAMELATQVDRQQLRRKLANNGPEMIYEFAEAVWNAQARQSLERGLGSDAADLHDDFLFCFVRSLRSLLELPDPG